MILDRDLTGHQLAVELHELLDDPGALTAMGQGAHILGRPDAASHLADLVCQLAGERGGERTVRHIAEQRWGRRAGGNRR